MAAEPNKHEVIINGEPERVPVGMTLDEVLQWENLAINLSPGIAVALNDEVIAREAWKDHAVQEGDRIEIVTATQGG